MTPSGSKPGDTLCSRTKLRTRRPAPMSSITEMATSATTSRLRRRPRRLPKPPSPWAFRPPALSDVLRSTRAARNAGARPNSRPVRIDTPNVKARTVPSSAIASSRGMLPGLIVADHLQRELRDDETRRAAEEPEQQALRQQLSRQSLPARAERGPDGNLLLPAGRAREQQVGDVGARDEEHERHRSQQHQHRQPDVADDGFDERNDVDREGPVALVLLSNAIRRWRRRPRAPAPSSRPASGGPSR